MRKETEDAEAVIDRDEDDPLACERLAVVAWLGAGPGLEAAAVNPHHHRQAIGRRRRGRPDVQVQAIFAGWAAKVDVAEDVTLHALRAELDRIAHALPRRRGLRFPPAVLADRRRRVRNALEDAGP